MFDRVADCKAVDDLPDVIYPGSLSCGVEDESSSPRRSDVCLLQKDGNANDLPECVPDVEDHPLHRDHQPLER